MTCMILIKFLVGSFALVLTVLALTVLIGPFLPSIDGDELSTLQHIGLVLFWNRGFDSSSTSLDLVDQTRPSKLTL